MYAWKYANCWYISCKGGLVYNVDAFVWFAFRPTCFSWSKCVHLSFTWGTKGWCCWADFFLCPLVSEHCVMPTLYLQSWSGGTRHVAFCCCCFLCLFDLFQVWGYVFFCVFTSKVFCFFFSLSEESSPPLNFFVLFKVCHKIFCYSYYLYICTTPCSVFLTNCCVYTVTKSLIF